ncbi:putative RTA1 domain protein [Aaosphaeria arxii CBS 175.79]|uniref:Putative RTA1 domain protein n=1 Tax=Aaosphaeria arxii CBS 175.79 TaxID=1450172 RepID=A0A6A5XZF7_9PLEO|nr:putative RTA1 domain protein [Aaosphaeria arxii CBS 175.79]KAF2018356.1 putative RTA1 domain protein [Aaosphaeria arxii CBS 175.79]
MYEHTAHQARGIADFDLFPYTPSAPAAWTFVVLFGIAAVLHFGYMVTFQSWFFIPFILGCIGEAGGYYGRAWAHQNIRNGTPYLIQMMLILGSAPLLAATVYMTLGRFATALDARQHSLLGPKKTTTLFVVIDIASFVCQMWGSAAQASGPEGAAQGMKIVLGGLGVQLVALLCFVGMVAVLHVRLNREPTSASRRAHIRWRKYVWGLYAVSVLFLARNVFRFVEFAEGADGSIVRTEALMYVFDASLLFAGTVVFLVVHPGMLIRGLRKAGVGMMEDEEDKDGVLLGGYRR